MSRSERRRIIAEHFQAWTLGLFVGAVLGMLATVFVLSLIFERTP